MSLDVVGYPSGRVDLRHACLLIKWPEKFFYLMQNLI